jgi:hypothetical protein
LLRFCGLLTLAYRQYCTALVDAVGPSLDATGAQPVLDAPQIHATRPAPGSRDEQQAKNENQPLNQPIPAAARPPALLARTRELDAEHRTTTGRPISRDNLRVRCPEVSGQSIH